MDLSVQMVTLIIEVIEAFKRLENKDDIRFAKKGLRQLFRAITDGYGYPNAKFSEKLIIKALNDGISLEKIRDTKRYDDQINILKDRRTKQEGGQKYIAEHKYPVVKILNDLLEYPKLNKSNVLELFRKADMVWITMDENERLKEWKDEERPDDAYDDSEITIIDLKNQKEFMKFKRKYKIV